MHTLHFKSWTEMAEERREGRGGSYCRSVNPILTRGQILPTLLLLEWTLQIFEQFGGSSGDFQNVLKISFSLFFLWADQERAKHCCKMGWIGYAILQVDQKAVREIQFLAYFYKVENYFYRTSPLWKHTVYCEESFFPGVSGLGKSSIIFLRCPTQLN